jgi:hypothetical protein
MRVIVAIFFCAASAFGQYGGVGSPSTPGGTTSGTGYGYKSSTGIAIGAVVAAGVVVTYLIVHSHHKSGKVVGCLAGSPASLTLLDDKKSSYAVVNGSGAPLTTGERLALTGKKLGGSSFEVRGVAKDYGPCTQ